MTRDEMLTAWRQRLSVFKEFHTQVDGETVARQVLADIEGLAAFEADETLSLTEASKEGGVSTRQLSRLIRQGALENVGRKNAPRVRRSDIPRKSRVAKNVIADASCLSLSRRAITSKLASRGKNGTQG